MLDSCIVHREQVEEIVSISDSTAAVLVLGENTKALVAAPSCALSGCWSSQR